MGINLSSVLHITGGIALCLTIVEYLTQQLLKRRALFSERFESLKPE